MPTISIFPTTCSHVMFAFDGQHYEFIFDSDFDENEPDIIKLIKVDIAENNTLNTAQKVRDYLNGKIY